MSARWTVITADCRSALASLPERSVHACVTSPPYFGLRDYGHDEQIGLEPTPDEFVASLVEVFRSVRRVLRDDGTVWLNLGDSYNARPANNTKASGFQQEGAAGQSGALAQAQGLAPGSRYMEGSKPKDLLGIPWLVAFALRADGWYLRSEIIWHKPNPMPESVTDRPTKAHEQLFLLSKSPRYYYDADAIREDATWTRENNPDWQAQRAVTNAQKGAGNRNAADGGFTAWDHTQGRNKRSVWTVATQPYSGAHFATFPPKLITPCVLAGAPERCCSSCGQPWKRIVERTPMLNTLSERVQTRDPQEARTAISGTMLQPPTSRTLGFEPDCNCDAPPIAGTVLDPFTGAGTTGLVALRHDRSFIGTELNTEYADIARQRIRDDAPLMNTVSEHDDHKPGETA